MITPAYSLTSTERVLPKLALDFTTGTLDSRVAVTRALNTATRVNSSGLVEIVNANLPRFDYDPTTLVCRGLLIEELRANLALYSSDFADPTWQKTFIGVASAPVVTPNYAVAPDGTTTAARVVFSLNGGTTTGAISTLEQSVTYTAASYAGSFWLKSNTGANQTILLVIGNATVSTLTVTPTWQRFSGTRTTSSGLSNFALRSRGTFTGDTTDISVWGAQVELGAFATSYIPTTTTSLTRNADVVSMTGTNFSDWYNASEGAFAAWFLTPDPSIGLLGDQTAASAIMYSSNLDIKTFNGSSSVIATGAFSLNTLSKAVLSYSAAGRAIALNGNTVAQDANTLQSVTTLEIGRAFISVYLNGHCAKVLYYPQRLTDAETRAFSKG